MKIGDLVKLRDSKTINGRWAGLTGLIVGFDQHDNPVINVDGAIKDFHYTQIEVICK